MPKQCPYCPNPDKSRWLHDCRYTGVYASHEKFAESQFDPPCAMDDYDEGQRELERATRVDTVSYLLIGIAAVLVMAFLIWMVKPGRAADRIPCWQVEQFLRAHGGDRAAARRSAVARGAAIEDVLEAERRCLR